MNGKAPLYLATMAQMVACLPLVQQGSKFSTSELGGVEVYTF